MGLTTYRKKRHFNRTAEPKGKVQKTTEPIFVVQKHAASHLHYDFRLAINGVLKSWAIPKGPSLDPAVKRLAVEVEDHPLDYATFEGTIPHGEYGGGDVIVWDYGQWQAPENLAAAYQKGTMAFTLQGQKLTGAWKLIRLKSTNKKPQWLLIKTKDKYSKKLANYDVTTAEPASVLSGKTLTTVSPEKNPTKRATCKNKQAITKASLPAIFKPELATLSAVLPAGNKWIFETKFDGYRILAFLNKREVRLISRNQQDWTHRFPAVVTELKKLNLANTILDGELVVLDKNKKSNFQLLQNALNRNTAQTELHYFVFDLPFYKSNDLTNLPLIERKTILAREIFQKNYLHIHYSEHLEGDAETLLKAACRQGLEGIMAKEKHATYQQTRTKEWLKLKCHQRQEFIVIGYTEPTGSRQYFGALLLAYYDKNQKLIYCGHVGTGFNKKSLQELYAKLKSLEQDKMPLTKKPNDPLARKVHWVKPKLVVEVEFTEWTEDNILRHPSFQGLREDKPAKQIKQELPIKNLTTFPALTHPEKILYLNAKITKLDLAQYYAKIADKLLPHIQNRPLTLLRCPADNKCFLQKHWMTGMPEGLEKIKLSDESEPKEYITLEDKEGLMGLAQLATLEIHPWASRKDKLDYPDQLILDLDPDVDLKWKVIIDAALLVHETLENLGFENFVKLTGGKGLHVVAPLAGKQPYSQVKAFTKLLAEKLAKHFPQVFTANISKKGRTGKIFIDYLRNEKEATAIAPFSPRHDEMASVAVPISWEKLPSFKNSKAYSIKTIENYFKDFPKNPWESFFKLKQAITQTQQLALQCM
jgi:bifunctional non-homologous end joining protein LigD